MQTITLQYRNKKYAAHILSSTYKEPHFHWLIFNDAELKKIAGGEDSICFQVIKGELVCTSLLLRVNTPALVDTAKAIIEAYLAEQQQKNPR